MKREKPFSKFPMQIDKKFIIALITALLLIISALYSFKSTSAGSTSTYIFINEVMTSNRYSVMDEDGDYPDWIEIINPFDNPINLKGYGLSDDKKDPLKWEFPDITLEGGKCLLIFASGKDRKDPDGKYLHTNFKLDSNGETILLYGKGQVIDEVIVPKLPRDISYGRKLSSVDEWAYYESSTPGGSNSTLGYEHPVNNTIVEDSPVFISEIMTSNKTTVVDEDGDYSDWIEILNTGSEEINLNGYGLSDNIKDPFKWKFPGIIIKPGQCLLVFGSGKDRRDMAGLYLHTNFKLGASGEPLIFCNARGQIIDQLQLAALPPNVSYGRQEGERDRWLYYPKASPGEVNNTHGFASLLTGDNKIIISEVMALNRVYAADEDGDYSDWIEIVNTGRNTINLNGYSLSDDKNNTRKWMFPDCTIAPGQYIIVYASGKDKYNAEKNIYHTNFKLGVDGQEIILSNDFGIIVDQLNTGKLVADISCGRAPGSREGKLYFDKPTPGKPNAGKYYNGFTTQVLFSKRGGFYTEPFYLTLDTLSKAAEIHFTLDGSEPTINSPVYKAPILIDKIVVIRARSFEKNMLPSPIETNSFFINKTHTLTVISLSTNPDNLWDQKNGIYVKGDHASDVFPYVGANFWMNMEKPVHFELFETDGRMGLSMDGGLKIFGSYSRAMDQKSFSFYARDIYGCDRISYPFFADKQIPEFKSILFRTSGQDAVMTKIRDAMMGRLIKDTGVDYQAYRPAVVYLNGKYWGIYNIREKISPYYLEENHGADPENVDLLEANGRVKAGSSADYKALVSYVSNNDMGVAKNYEYIKSKMDIQNFMDYQIAEIYFANTDTGNIKFWRENIPGGKWRWILYDTDWGFFNVNHNTLWYVTNPEGTGVGKRFSTALMYNLLKNDNFKRDFINRLAYHLNNTFKSDRVMGIIDEMAKVIEPEIPENQARWGGTVTRWRNQVQKLREFARQRPAILAGFIKEQFNLSSEEMKIFNIR